MTTTSAGPTLIMALDQGTTSSRALIFDSQFNIVGRGQHEFAQYFPHDGWVEHDPEEIWSTTLQACRDALRQANCQAKDIAALGITNQRETTVVWERDTGKPLYRAIVWQDRRTSAYCESLRKEGHEAMIQEKAGLLLDPYFSGTKVRWLLDNIPNGQERAAAGELCFGTIDSYLLWRLTGNVHATDASNASRTLLMNLATCDWDDELLALFNIPRALLPTIRDNACLFGNTSASLFGAEIPITAMIGDQQAALLGQGCIDQGQVKSTYGTGCFALVNTGHTIIRSEYKLLSTLAWRLDGQPTYALEGSIFMAGAIVQWLRDKLGIIQRASETESLSEGVSWQQTELLIPAFTGLGAPYWRPDARAAIFGMTRDTGRRQIAAAALRSVAYQTQDLLRAMSDDGQDIQQLRVDGGMTDNGWFMQALSDVTCLPVLRANSAEITVRGAAFLAGLQVGIFDSLQDIQRLARSKGRFEPELNRDERDQLYDRWLAAVDKVR
ncbi:MAG: glycerol kinase GlpK [Idiomarina sp.]|nr:glycerol kinase GlpK [Idiomarina sp.]